MYRRFAALVLSLVVIFSFFTGCTEQSDTGNVQETDGLPVGKNAETETDDDTVVYGEEYNDLLSVSAYIYEWEELPPNYITKDEAESLGWQSSKGNLWDVAYGCSIGGDYFGNREGLLPEGESYRECDINYEGGFRGGERLVYSTDDYDIYYTADHYESFIWVYSYEDGYIMEQEIILD